VPLDWADPNKGLIPLSVIQLPATQQPRQGYMFFNPGGPGGSGLIFLANNGMQLQQQLGSSWDVLSWDPRGVYDSGPNITLFSTDEEHANFWKRTQGKDRVDAHGNLTTSSDVDF
ncbi:6844_t:CDS:2, partial [Acaulospora colombiana]